MSEFGHGLRASYNDLREKQQQYLHAWKLCERDNAELEEALDEIARSSDDPWARKRALHALAYRPLKR